MFNICSYQQRISFGLCLLFIYYQGFSSLESYELGQSRFSHDATQHLNYLPLYVLSIYEQSKMTIDYYYSQQQTNMQQLNAAVSFLISFYLICELLFYCRWKYLEHYIHANVSMFDTKPALSEPRRKHLLKMMAKYAELHGNGIKQWACGWFPGCEFEEIYDENAIEFLEWAFHIHLDESEHKRDWSQVIRYGEKATAHTFTSGYNPDVAFIRNTDDDIALSTTYRPLLFYIVIQIFQWLSDLVYSYILCFSYKYVNGLKVWYKIQSAAQNKESKPILLVHGLTAAHYIAYIPMVYKLLCKSPQNDIFCVEIPWTVMSLWHFIPKSIWKLFSNEASPSYIDSRLPATKKDFVNIVQQMEDLILCESGSVTHDLYERSDRNALKLQWTLIGHSYGTFLVAGIYDYIRKGTRCGNDINLPRMILLDPVTLCLTHPTTVSFLTSTADDWHTYILQHLAPREIMIACTLRKYFHWFEYNIFPEDLINSQVEHVVVTATCDTLIPYELITKGIKKVNESGKDIKGYKKIHQISFENKHHAVALFSMSCVQRIVDAV